MPKGGQIVAALCGNLNPFARMARTLPLRRMRAGSVSPAGFGRDLLGQDLRLIRRGKTMFNFQDLFQWDRFITPTIIKTFYWLIIALICLLGISGIFSGLAAMAVSPFAGFLVLLYSIASVVVGIVFSRIAAEFILIVFRINEHLGAIRDQGMR
jgi:ABC-type sugar transport system permease subunit